MQAKRYNTIKDIIVFGDKIFNFHYDIFLNILLLIEICFDIPWAQGHMLNMALVMLEQVS